MSDRWDGPDSGWDGESANDEWSASGASESGPSGAGWIGGAKQNSGQPYSGPEHAAYGGNDSGQLGTGQLGYGVQASGGYPAQNSGGYPQNVAAQPSGGYPQGYADQNSTQSFPGQGFPGAPGGQGYEGQGYATGFDQQRYGPEYGPGYEPREYSDGGSGGRKLLGVMVAVITVLVLLLGVLAVVLFRSGKHADDGTQAQAPLPTASGVPSGDGGAHSSGSPGGQSSTSSSSSSSSTTHSTTSAKPTAPPRPADASECAGSGVGLFSRSGIGTSVTSCPFAEEVRQAYVASGANGAAAHVSAYSPVTGQSYDMTCAPTAKNVIRCTGGNSAVVYVY